MKGIQKSKILIGVLLLATQLVQGQTFTPLPSTNYGTTNGYIILADLNRNDTLEVIITGVDTLGQDVLLIYSIDTTGKLFNPVQIDIPNIKNPKLQVSDINNNELIDILISGNVESNPYFNILLNRSGFEFDNYPAPLPQFNGDMRLADFNNDGLTDLIASSTQPSTNDTITLYTNLLGAFSLCDSCSFIPLHNTRLLDIDANNNGFIDIITSSDANNGQVFYLNRNINNQRFDTVNLSFENFTNPLFSKGDFTKNGFLDVLVGGKINGRDSLLIYKNMGDKFEVEQGLSLADSLQQIISGDFTNDGLLDLLVLTRNEFTLYYNNGAGIYDTLTRKIHH